MNPAVSRVIASCPNRCSTYAGKSVWYTPTRGTPNCLAAHHPTHPTGPGVEIWIASGLNHLAYDSIAACQRHHQFQVLIPRHLHRQPRPGSSPGSLARRIKVRARHHRQFTPCPCRLRRRVSDEPRHPVGITKRIVQQQQHPHAHPARQLPIPASQRPFPEGGVGVGFVVPQQSAPGRSPRPVLRITVILCDDPIHTSPMMRSPPEPSFRTSAPLSPSSPLAAGEGLPQVTAFLLRQPSEQPMVQSRGLPQ